MKKLLATIMALVMALSLLPTTAMADTTETLPSASNGYILLDKANATYQLSSNVTSLVAVTAKNVTIDLNGHNISVTHSGTASGVYMAVQVHGGSLTLKDSKEGTGAVSVTMTSGNNQNSQAAGVYVENNGSLTLQSGKITATANNNRDAFGVLVSGGETKTNTGWATAATTSSFTMSGGSVTAEYGVRVEGKGATFNMTGGEVFGSSFGVSGHGNDRGGTKINISGGTILGSKQIDGKTVDSLLAIYHPQVGTLTITGGTLTGRGGIEMKAGTANISKTEGSETKITATAPTAKYDDWNTGNSTEGYALAIVEDNDYAEGIDVTIDGGTFGGKVAILKSGAETVYAKSTLKIASGLFSGDESGYVVGDVCNGTTEDGYVVKTSHDYTPSSTQSTEPTCTTDGQAVKVCATCNETETTVLAASGHDFTHGAWASDETNHWKVCARCDATDSTTKAAHTWSSEDEENKKYCTVCGAKCSHTEVTKHEGKAATCTVDGYKESYTCNSCGQMVVPSEPESGTYTVAKDTNLVIVASHQEVEDQAEEATCTATGKTAGKHCSVCDEVLIAQQTVEMKPHTYEAGTYTTDAASHWNTCSVCSGKVNKAAHTWGETTVTKEATKTEKGQREKTCTVCSYTLVEDFENDVVVEVKDGEIQVQVNGAAIDETKKTATIDATSSNEDGAKAAAITVAPTVTKKLKNSEVETVTIKTNLADLTLDKKALATVLAGTDVNDNYPLEITITESHPSATKQQFEITATVNGTNVFVKSNGYITVTVPKDAPGFRQQYVCYCTDNGGHVRMGGIGYSNKTFSWRTNHFSTFVIETETVSTSRAYIDLNGSSSGTTATTTTVKKTASANTFDAGVGVYAATAILSVTGMAWVGKKKH